MSEPNTLEIDTSSAVGVHPLPATNNSITTALINGTPTTLLDCINVSQWRARWQMYRDAYTDSKTRFDVLRAFVDDLIASVNSLSLDLDLDISGLLHISSILRAGCFGNSADKKEVDHDLNVINESFVPSPSSKVRESVVQSHVSCSFVSFIYKSGGEIRVLSKALYILYSFDLIACIVFMILYCNIL